MAVNVDVIRKILEAELRRKISDKPKKPFLAFANFQFEGVLKKGGDQVTVPISPKIVMQDVSEKNDGDLRKTSLEDIDIQGRDIPTDTLVVNKMHNYGEKFSDLEEIQTLYSIRGERLKDLVEGMLTQLEKSIIQMLDAFFAAHPEQTVTPTEELTIENIAHWIMKLRTALSKKEIPMENRVLIVSPDISSLISQAKILSGTEEGAKDIIEGWLGRFGGFKIYESNLIADDVAYAFRPKSYNYVRQLYKTEINKAERGMYYNLLGQMVHGGKVFDQNAEQLVKLESFGSGDSDYTDGTDGNTSGD